VTGCVLLDMMVKVRLTGLAGLTSLVDRLAEFSDLMRFSDLTGFVELTGTDVRTDLVWGSGLAELKGFVELAGTGCCTCRFELSEKGRRFSFPTGFSSLG